VFNLETAFFQHDVTSAGPANGMSFTGRERMSAPTGEDTPLVVALHGGGYTSAYFDVTGYSLVDRAALLGVPIVAIDRPGYGGSSSVDDADSVISQNAAVLDHLIGEVWESKGAGTTGVVVVGHSIGSAVALEVASRRPNWPLLGLAVSGFLLEASPGDQADFSGLPDLPRLDIPEEYKAELMFGPAWTRPEGMPEASHSANAPVVRAELIECISHFLTKAPTLAAAVTVPVHIPPGRVRPKVGHR